MANRQVLDAQVIALQEKFVELEDWVVNAEARVVILFEGRDAAGKGGIIKRITERMNPRGVRVVALPAPSDREKGQWYLQRYIAHLPSKGEIVIFDRSWYNRAGVEHVMGFCTDAEYGRFLVEAPAFEQMLVDDGIILVKYWLSVSPGEQHRRLSERAADPAKRWKLSPTDAVSISKYNEYSEAKDRMVETTHTAHAPWFVVEADDKRVARVNLMTHLLSYIPWMPVVHDAPVLPSPVRQGSSRRDRAASPVPDVAAAVVDHGLTIPVLAGPVRARGIAKRSQRTAPLQIVRVKPKGKSSR